jgi:hypothetical protein
MKGYCCGCATASARKVELRSSSEFDPRSGGPDSSAFESYREEMTVRWADVYFDDHHAERHGHFDDHHAERDVYDSGRHAPRDVPSYLGLCRRRGMARKRSAPDRS